MIEKSALQDVERVARIVMIAILVTAGTSKFFSHGGFFNYYSQLFQGENLRIHLPTVLVDAYLKAIPFIEVGLGLALFSNRYRWLAVHGWHAFMLSLLFGHYILQEWSPVNEIVPYFFLGMLCLALPNHQSWFRRDPA
jgi:hypothetical protein